MVGITVNLGADPPEASISEMKVTKTLTLLRAVERARHVDVALARELHGMLQFVGRVLVAGRYHLSWTVNALRIAEATGRCQVREEHKREWAWWRHVVADWNRVAIILPPIYATPSFSWASSPTTDAAVSRSSRSGGGGGFFNGAYTHFRFTPLECKTL